MNRFKNAFEPAFLKTTFQTAFPIAMQFFLASAVNLIDVVMIGSLGDSAVAAAGGANQIFFLLNLMLFGINSGASVFLSQFWGTRDLKNVRRTMGMMYLLGAAAVTLFTLGALLIFGLCGFPALGLDGAAIATAIARTAECLFLILIVYKNKLPGAAKVKELFAFDRSFLTKYIKTAWPVLLNEILWSVGTSLYSVAYGMLGTSALAAVQISNTVIQLLFVFTRGLSNACGITIGRTVGTGDREKALDYGYRFSLLLPATGLLTGLVVIAIHPIFLGLYQVTPETLSMARTLLILQALMMTVKADSMALVVGIFRAGGDTMFACLLDTGTVWLVGVPLGFLAVFLGAPLWGVALCVYCDDIAKVAVGFVHLFRENWVKNVTAQIQEG